ncbi:MAG TPA: phytanoyl-CoA dioxygenase family protein [Acidimicrobiales bacterium]|nr:phytanoyl-CoA dioxygenase family protein [Acidimicrobiales bacterium]
MTGSSEVTPAQVERAVRDVRTAGYAVLDRALDPAALARLQTAFDAHLDAVIAGGPARLHPTGTNRANVWVPLRPPFTDPEIVADPVVLAVVRELLGEGFVCSYYASDTAFPGSEYQPVHLDEAPLFPGLGVTLPPWSIVLDIPLVDFRADNGPLDIWAQGTHLIPDTGLLPTEPAEGGPEARRSPIQRYAEELGPTPLLLPAGSLLVRDTRTWHRGTPNRSTERRSMLALVYSRPWNVIHTLPMAASVRGGLVEPVRGLFRNVFVEEAG